jgi:uncharacterized membrane protein YphA (DoxX/SURF4 family)
MDVLRRWTPLVFRAMVVWQLTWPALSKFVLYDSRVEHFRHDYGIPFPEVMVPVVGTFETTMVIAALSGLAGRLATIPVIAIMLNAITTGGTQRRQRHDPYRQRRHPVAGNGATVAVGSAAVVAEQSGGLAADQR